MKKNISFLALITIILLLPLATIKAEDTPTLCNMLKTAGGLILTLGGSMTVIGWVIAGILFLGSAGSPEKTGTAKKAVFAAVIGTVLVILAWYAPAIVRDAIGGGTWGGCIDSPAAKGV